MDNKIPWSVMNRRIFSMGLSTEAISAYIICCNLADNGKTISKANIASFWNSTSQDLVNSLEELIRRNVLRKVISDMEGREIYAIEKVQDWTFREQ
nr:hypothetical protein [Desulfobacterales bacterium]